jgi:hypothetical protein
VNLERVIYLFKLIGLFKLIYMCPYPLDSSTSLEITELSISIASLFHVLLDCHVETGAGSDASSLSVKCMETNDNPPPYSSNDVHVD